MPKEVPLSLVSHFKPCKIETSPCNSRRRIALSERFCRPVWIFDPRTLTPLKKEKTEWFFGEMSGLEKQAVRSPLRSGVYVRDLGQ